MYSQFSFANKLKEEVIPLGSPPKGYELIPASVIPSPHLRHLGFVCVSRTKKSMIAIIDGKQSMAFDAIAKGYPRFSPDGKHFLLVGEKDHKAYVLLDKTLSRGYDLVYKAMFTPDGEDVVFIARDNNQEFLVVNGRPWKAYPAIAEKICPVFSPNSKKIAIIAEKPNKKSTLVVNNKELGEYDLVLKPVFSPDSNHIAYPVKIGTQYRLRLDNKFMGDKYDEIRDITFSPDSKNIAFVARQGKKFLLILNGQKQREALYIGQPIFSPDSKHLAYMEFKDKKMFIVLDNKPGPKLDQIGVYFFSPDNKLLYMGVKDKKGCIFINNNPQKFFDSVGLPVVSKDGKHIAYRARKGSKWFIVLDGKPGPSFELVRRPKFSPEGKHLAYIARENKHYICVEDNKPGKPYVWTDFPYFSKDGKHVAYVASNGKGTFIVLDGRESNKEFLGFLKGVPLIFSGHCVTGQALNLPGPEFFKVNVCLGN